MSRAAQDSLAYTLVFAIGYHFAWSNSKPFWGVPGIHAAFGNSGLVPMMPPPVGVRIAIKNSCPTTVASFHAEENATPNGFSIFLLGAINNLGEWSA
jgi:hypothetical protein